MNNADRENLDGFAAETDHQQGNVFDGCIAAYNADDTGPVFKAAGTIGAVTIQKQQKRLSVWRPSRSRSSR